jgi:hypothetical protein
MSAGKYDLYIEQGATFQRDCLYTDSTGAPIDLTGMTMQAQIRRSYSDPTVTQAITITILPQTGSNVGKFTMLISAVDTASIAVNTATDFENAITNFTWDLELNTGGTVRRLMQGTVYVSPEVTR